MAQNMENIEFLHIFHCNFTTMVYTEVKLWFLSSLENFMTRSIGYFVRSCFIYFEKMHKTFKNKAQRCSTPLTLLQKPHFLPILWLKVDLLPDLGGCAAHTWLQACHNLQYKHIPQIFGVKAFFVAFGWFRQILE